jgi:hypothetical protein
MLTASMSDVFRLIGHDCPVGSYPSVLVPVLVTGDQLFVAYHGPTEPELVAIPPDALFEKHGAQTAVRLSGFNYLTDGLFGFSRDDLQFFPYSDARRFFADILSSPRLAHVDPFYGLSLALASRDRGYVRTQFDRCVDRMALLEEVLAERWYFGASARIANALPTIILPPSYRDALHALRPRKDDETTLQQPLTFRETWTPPLEWRSEERKLKQPSSERRGTPAWALRRFVSDILSNLIVDLEHLTLTSARSRQDDLQRIGNALFAIAEESHALTREYLTSAFSKQLYGFAREFQELTQRSQSFKSASTQESVHALRFIRQGIARTLREQSLAALGTDWAPLCFRMVEIMAKALPEHGFNHTQNAVARFATRRRAAKTN